MTQKSNKAKQIEKIAAAANQAGWFVAVPNTEDPKDEIRGMIIGTKEYVNDVVGELVDDYVVFEPEMVH